jgi:GR25 family glycosyltransferase involved in LPS biosynthesis
VSYAGFYINLDRSLARRAEIEAEISGRGLAHLYRRFPAADGNVLGFPNPHLSSAEIGCFTSHVLLLKQNLPAQSHLHIVEDDAVFSRFTAETVRAVTASAEFEGFDILFTESYVATQNRNYQQCKALYDSSVTRDAAGRVTDVRTTIIGYVAGMSSYIVNYRSVPKLLDIFMRELANGTPNPIDLVIREEIRKGAIRVGCLFPFVTTIRLAAVTDNTITDREQDLLTQMAANLARYSFFVDCDHDALGTQARQLLPLPEADPHHRLLGHILAFSITEQFRPY